MIDGPARVTVVICAYTMARWAELSLAVDQVAADPVPHRTILVVDHNDELRERARVTWPDLTVLPNAGQQGLSAARNTALAAVDTELIAFLDDDAYPEPGWLDSLLGPFADTDVVATGGVAEPIWPRTAAPAWLPRELWWIVGCSFTGQPDGERVRNVMGCNMAFRAAPLRAVGGFNTSMGRVGTRPVGGEETEVCILLRPGRVAFTPEALVHHHVTADRVRFRYLVRRSYGEGLTKAWLAGSAAKDQALSTETGYVATVLPRAVMRGILHPVKGWGAAAGIVCSVGAAGVGFVRGRLGA